MNSSQLPDDISFQSIQVSDKFAQYPQQIRAKLLYLRALIFSVAAQTSVVGVIEETLKWGEPSYLTSQTKSGSTIRIDWKKNTPALYYMYFNCNTTLVDTFKEIYGDTFTYSGNRALVFNINDPVLLDALSDCIAMALTYKHNK